MTDITTSASVRIAAPPQRVWDAITTPAEIKRWFFGVDTETDWRVGSRLVHRGEYQGKPYEDSGEIIEIDPPRLLIHTHWSPMSGLADRPEHYQRVTWTLDGTDGTTTLTVAETTSRPKRRRRSATGAGRRHCRTFASSSRPDVRRRSPAPRPTDRGTDAAPP